MTKKEKAPGAANAEGYNQNQPSNPTSSLSVSEVSVAPGTCEPYAGASNAAEFLGAREDETATASFEATINVVEAETRLCKLITMQDGRLSIEGAVQPYAGSITTHPLASMTDLSALVARLNPNQALMCSNTAFAEPITFTTEHALTSEKRAQGVIARTKQFFRWQEGPAIMPLDHDDKGGAALSCANFDAALQAVFPAFANCARLTTWSSSSCIYNAESGEELRGQGSFHAYCLVANGSDIPRFTDVLHKRLWLSGHGHIWIDKVGKMHERSIIDNAIYGPQGVMFEASPQLGSGIEQRRPAAVVRDGGVLDTETLSDLTPEEENRYAELVVEAKAKMNSAANKAQRQYRAREIQKLVGRGVEEASAKAAVESRLQHKLSPSDLLYFDDLPGPMTVEQVVENAAQLDGKTLADPIQPDYGGTPGSITKCKAKFFANLHSGQPVIHSFVHGGTIYRLPQQLEAAEPGLPPRPKINDAWVDEMNKGFAVIDDSGNVFVMGTESVRPAIYATQSFHLKFDNERVVTGYKSNGDPVCETKSRAWLAHKRRREYDGITFDAGPNPPADKFNLWRGFGLEPKAGDWSKMQWHLDNIICAGDPERITYARRYLAWMFQNPGVPPQVAFAMLSREEGTGKGTLMQWIGEIVGPAHYVRLDSVSHITGQFNEILLSAAVAFLDEAVFAGNPQEANRLKGLITEPTITIEGKFKPRVQVANHVAYFIASNEAWAVPAGRTARRYFVTQVSAAKRGDTSYWVALDEERCAGGPAAMLHDLLNVDLGGWKPWHDVPQTDALMQQKLSSLSPLEQFIRNQVEDEGFFDCRAPGAYDYLRNGGDLKKENALSNWDSNDIFLDRTLTHDKYTEFAQQSRGGLAIRVEGRDAMGTALRDMLGADDARPRVAGKPTRQWRVPQRERAKARLDEYLKGQ